MTKAIPLWARGAGALATAVYAMALATAAQAQEATSLPTASTPPAAEPPTPSLYAIQAQSTFTDQGTAGFTSPYRGPNSLDPGARGRETFDATLYGGLRLWKGAEIWVNPEVDQGFGLSNTLGLAGFPSGEAYKVGESSPYIKLPRLFFRQTISLGGETQSVELAQNQLAQTFTANRLVLWAGKMSVGDVFDNNQYTLDPRNYFLNWSIINAGSFDYAANAWGFTDGVAGEWYQGPWTARAGLYLMSEDPNGEKLDYRFGEFQIVAEVERRYSLFGQPGVIKLTAFDSRARMGDFADAIRLAEATGQTPDVLQVRQYRGHAGLSYNWAQQVGDDLGVFSRLGFSDGHQQSYEFTDVERTFMMGAALTGKRWGRAGDTVGVAYVANEISKDFEAYLNDGGLGILVGDGKLPHPGAEQVIESYYSYAVTSFARVTFDYQLAINPAYNTDRGPVNIFAIRLHLQADKLLP